MSISEKVNILLAIINSLVFIVMLIALFLQRISIKQNKNAIKTSQEELKSTIIGLKIQVYSNLISHKMKELDFIEKNSSLETQKKFNQINQDIEKYNQELQSLTKKIMED